MGTLIRIALIAALAPFWWPLAKTILAEFRALLSGSGPISRDTFQRGAPPRDPESDHLTSVPLRGPQLGTRGFDASPRRRPTGVRGFRSTGDLTRRRRGA